MADYRTVVQLVLFGDNGPLRDEDRMAEATAAVPTARATSHDLIKPARAAGQAVQKLIRGRCAERAKNMSAYDGRWTTVRVADNPR